LIYRNSYIFRVCVRLEETPNGDVVGMLAIYPDLNEDTHQVYSEMIFLVDQSGSMAGSKMASVKNTLQIFLRSLPEGTMFNIIGFGTNFSKLFPTSVEYNEKNFATATAHVDKITANMGGTNILTPLASIFTEKTKEGIPRQIFLLTDGEVSNTFDCINAVKRQSKTTRVFTFGIGDEASKELVKGIAKAGNGQFELIPSNATDLEARVMRQLTSALKPALTDVIFVQL
jgi:uncharacterized protein with von Willebrand factor type A (vWA) domain